MALPGGGQVFQVEALQHVTAPHALRRLQEVFGHAVSDLPLPGRYTRLRVEEDFQRQLRFYICEAYRWLRLVRASVMRVYPNQVVTYLEVHENVALFDEWIMALDPFTSIRGLRTLQHQNGCISRRCIVYGCSLRTVHDEFSVRVYPDHLHVVRNTRGRIVSIIHLF